MNYQSYRENKVKEKQVEKERLDKEKENEIINNCKVIKKPKKNVDEFCNRMYDEAKRRDIRSMKKKENYEDEEKNLSCSSKVLPIVSKDYKTERNGFNDDAKNKSNKSATKYNFQVNLVLCYILYMIKVFFLLMIFFSLKIIFL